MKDKKTIAKRQAKLARPTDSELAILEILKDLKTGTVRQILKLHNQIYEAQAGYTTILKIIQIMTEKGLVEKDASQRPQVYKPSVSWKKTQQVLLTDLMEKAFSGSAKDLVLGALSSKAVSEEELEEIEKFLDKIGDVKD
jgi:BlaI family transcriptional regulator, penicillinase repressor